MASDPFAKILVNDGIVSAEQLAEAVKLAGASGKKLQDEVVRLGYASGEKVMRALAKAHHLKYVDIAKVEITSEIVGLLPESIARENSAQRRGVGCRRAVTAPLRVAVGSGSAVGSGGSEVPL
ncbi:MAG: hypothetical protein ACKO35_16525, partial [Planctomycetaceae bacterium]